MDINLDILPDDVPMFDPYDKAEMYTWHCDAEAKYLRGAGGYEPHTHEDDAWAEENWEDEGWEDGAARSVKTLGGDRMKNPVDFSTHPRL
jgi:hypothetical protein